MTERTKEGGSLVAAVVQALAAYGAVAAAKAGRQASATAAGYLTVGVLFAASLCFLTIAGHGALSAAIGPIYGALIVGCVYFVGGLVALIILQARHR